MTKEEYEQLARRADRFIGRILQKIGSQQAILDEQKFEGYRENRRGENYYPTAVMLLENGTRKDEDLAQIVYWFELTSK